MNDITVEELKVKLDNKDNVILIDVREPYENEEFNIGGQLIPLGSLIASLDDLEEYKDDEIVIYCRSGQRSGAAKETLKQLGFKKVRNLLGGMLDWQDKFVKG